MALSEYERKMLEELESQLKSGDSEFREGINGDIPRPGQALHLGVVPRNLIIGLIVVVCGLGIVLLGVSAELVPVGVLGVAVIFAGFWYLSNGFVRRVGPGRPRKKMHPPAGADFMQKQAEEWIRRLQNRDRH
ncbi:DUF3040 domain-containing protein [Arcanobacterium sp. S3PF19]|uniref:DUF3040 domain-containing protein n=1 Tax=Arcanobacterium sp. S3PF19 TaxID=1219585 RepID=UPI00050FABE0|nr:DUF3040 domain-containing protein [Arcanobacterium sp. S3PF19]KGF05454.1 hypothetical protein HMPREF1631_06510 [Arcanobacterium sp. S3PF19]